MSLDWLVITIFTLPIICPVRVSVSNSTESPTILKSARLTVLRSFELRMSRFQVENRVLHIDLRSVCTSPA